MTLIRFKQMHSDFHTETGTSFFGEKCHQLLYFIHILNDKPKGIFIFSEHGDLMREELQRVDGTVIYGFTTNINLTNIE